MGDAHHARFAARARGTMRRTRVGRLAFVLAMVVLPALGRADTDADVESIPEAQVVVTTIPATARQVAREVTSYGVVEPDPNATDVVALPRAGVIRKVLVRLGERVSAGQALVELDTAPGATMQYEQARAAVKYADEQLARLQRMAETRLATREQVAQAQRDLADAQATERSLRTVGANATQQTLRAPKDAIVTAVLVNAGDRSAADTAALNLAAVDGLIVRLGVEPGIAREIVAGTNVKLVSVFDSGRVIDAAANRVHAMLNPTTRLVDVIVPIAVEDAAALTLGSQMRGSISLGAIDAIIVPKSALLRDESGDYVFVVASDKAHRADVEVLLERQSDVAIQGEVAAGDAVVVAGGYQLSDGMRVASDHGAR